MRIHPFVNSDRKREPSDYPALAAFDIKVDRKSKFPALLLAIATVCRTIANARLRSELTKGCISLSCLAFQIVLSVVNSCSFLSLKSQVQCLAHSPCSSDRNGLV